MLYILVVATAFYAALWFSARKTNDDNTAKTVILIILVGVTLLIALYSTLREQLHTSVADEQDRLCFLKCIDESKCTFTGAPHDTLKRAEYVRELERFGLTQDRFDEEKCE